jgi:hypothetical protein
MASRNAPSLVYVDEKSVKALQDLAKTIKAQGEKKPSALTKRLNEEIREAAEPMRRDIADAALGLNFTRSGRASVQRSGKGRKLKSGKRATKRGLRAELSHGIRTQISKGAASAGVRIRMASKDPDVNAIGQRIDRDGFVRHPTRMGPNWRAINREVWAQTNTSNGKGWFYKAAEPGKRDAQRRIGAVLDKWTRDLARQIDRAA